MGDPNLFKISSYEKLKSFICFSQAVWMTKILTLAFVDSLQDTLGCTTRSKSEMIVYKILLNIVVN